MSVERGSHVGNRGTHGQGIGRCRFGGVVQVRPAKPSTKSDEAPQTVADELEQVVHQVRVVPDGRLPEKVQRKVHL